MTKGRAAEIVRSTKETRIRASLLVDGGGEHSIDTPCKVLNHLLSSMAKFSSFDVEVKARNVIEVDEHHIVEDVAICLGQALDRALGQRIGLTRFGFAITPMDECLVLSSVDLSGRGGCYPRLGFRATRIGDLSTSLIPHFFTSFASNGRLNLHLGIMRKGDDHHMAEALFKSVGLSLFTASRISRKGPPSTKGEL
jgi:imidazoleglycerol-phosphate dehydratase